MRIVQAHTAGHFQRAAKGAVASGLFFCTVKHSDSGLVIFE